MNETNQPYFAVRVPAWEQIGKDVKTIKTSAEVIVSAGLNYEVGKGYAFIQYLKEDVPKLGKGCQVKNTFFTYRRDNGTVLMSSGTAVTKQYQVIQNIEAFDFFDSIVGQDQATYTRAGMIGEGERIFVIAKLPQTIRLADNPDDIVEQYLIFVNSHDGSGTINIFFTPVRLYCTNQLNALFSRSINRIKIRHTKSAKDKLAWAQKLLGITSTYFLEFEESMRELANTIITQENTNRFVRHLILTEDEIRKIESAKVSAYTSNFISSIKKSQMNGLRYSIDNGVGQELYKGTALWLYNGLTYYLQNAIPYKDAEEQFFSLNEGDSYKKQNKGMAFLKSLIVK